jgi:hypothetical protein
VRCKRSRCLDWDKILRFVDPDRRAEVRATIEEHYPDVVTTNHPIVETPESSNGRVLRFKRDPMVRWIVDVALNGSGRLTLNDLWVAKESDFGGKWSRRKLKQFYRDMGYSLCGFMEMFPT